MHTALQFIHGNYQLSTWQNGHNLLYYKYTSNYTLHTFIWLVRRFLCLFFTIFVCLFLFSPSQYVSTTYTQQSLSWHFIWNTPALLACSMNCHPYLGLTLPFYIQQQSHRLSLPSPQDGSSQGDWGITDINRNFLYYYYYETLGLLLWGSYNFEVVLQVGAG